MVIDPKGSLSFRTVAGSRHQEVPPWDRCQGDRWVSYLKNGGKLLETTTKSGSSSFSPSKMVLFSCRRGIATTGSWDGSPTFHGWILEKHMATPWNDTGSNDLMIVGMWEKHCHVYHPWLGKVNIPAIYGEIGWFIIGVPTLLGMININHLLAKSAKGSWWREAKITHPGYTSP